MKRFYCDCGQEVFFENMFCSACGNQLGFDADNGQLVTLELNSDLMEAVSHHSGQTYKLCEHRNHPLQCNWLLATTSEAAQCRSCLLTRTIPVQSIVQNVKRWTILESAKRRLVYGLISLNMPLNGQTPLIFDFLEDRRSNPDVAQEFVYSGHSNGIITINVAEADSSYREATREAMNEPYRTLLGHFRHETGHYYWEQLITDTSYYADFTNLFGDDRLPYRETLDRYYATGPDPDWQHNFISAYASAHPLEDWAETWAHYLLMHEALETALAYGLINSPAQRVDFDVWMTEWMQLVVVLNALSRSIGNADAYPFVISTPVQQKLRFVHDLVHHTQQ